MIERLIEKVKELSSPTERGSSYDGFLSWSGEWHAFTHGLYDGFTTKRPTVNELPDIEDVQENKHYYKGAYLLGTLLQGLVSLIFIYAGSQVL